MRASHVDNNSLVNIPNYILARAETKVGDVAVKSNLLASRLLEAAKKKQEAMQ